jgi:hypothetical protein
VDRKVGHKAAAKVVRKVGPRAAAKAAAKVGHKAAAKGVRKAVSNRVNSLCNKPKRRWKKVRIT